MLGGFEMIGAAAPRSWCTGAGAAASFAGGWLMIGPFFGADTVSGPGSSVMTSEGLSSLCFFAVLVFFFFGAAAGSVFAAVFGGNCRFLRLVLHRSGRRSRGGGGFLRRVVFHGTCARVAVIGEARPAVIDRPLPGVGRRRGGNIQHP